MKSVARAAAVLLAVRCSTAPPPPAATAPAPPPPPVSASALEDHAGDSTETAIEVPQIAENGGVTFENEWIFNRFGRFRRRGGGTGVLNGRRYNVVKIELANGDEKTVYFDITENWKTWTPPK
jgi:hypothetical protein